MCTVTIVPIGFRPNRRIRIGCNRDDSPKRSDTMPPQFRHHQSRRALYPVDPVSDGTWIAVNDAGLVMLVLNRNRDFNVKPPALDAMLPHSKLNSRGTIIPQLLDCKSLAEAILRSQRLELECLAPFRLLILDRTHYFELDSTSPASSPKPVLLDSPLIFTSSGLGDDRVQAARGELFSTWFNSVKSDTEWEQQQDRFHLHAWPEKREISVFMRRTGAQTLSYTTIGLGLRSATVEYRAFAFGDRGDRSSGSDGSESHPTVAIRKTLDFSPIAERRHERV